MPLHKLTLPFAQVRGTMHNLEHRQGITLSDAPTQGHNARRYCAHQPPPTAAQRMIRSITGASAKAWAALPAATAAEWRTLAAKVTANNSLGYTYRLTGIALWNRVQFYRQLDGQAIDPTVPLLSDTPPPITLWLDPYRAGPFLTLTVYCPGAVGGARVFFRCTASSTNQARMRQPHELRILSIDISESFQTVTAGMCTFAIHPDNLHVEGNEWFGAQFTIMSASFLPRAPWFIPLREILL